MLRTFVLLLVLAVGVVWIDASWRADDRTLLLRVRETAEITARLMRAARSASERVLRAAGGEENPPVAARPPDRTPDERLTREDRARLDRLVQEKLAER